MSSQENRLKNFTDLGFNNIIDESYFSNIHGQSHIVKDSSNVSIFGHTHKIEDDTSILVSGYLHDISGNTKQSIVSGYNHKENDGQNILHTLDFPYCGYCCACNILLII